MAMGRLLDRVGRRLRRPSASFEEVQRAECLFYEGYVRDGMTVFDAGANIGALTLCFSRLAGSGSVHAFEASRPVFDGLSEALARGHAVNVVVNRLALFDAPGTLRLHCYQGAYHAFNSLADRPLAAYGIEAGEPHIEEVEATTIDLYCGAREIDRIDLLKIDVEGAELQVLRGARDMLGAKRIGCVAFEYGQTTFDMGNTPGEIAALFRTHDYVVENLVKGDPPFPGRTARSARFAMHLARPR